MFERILVANRGEIALRVVRACRELGARSVAVYSDADALSKHVREADDAYRLGPAAPAASYLNADRLFEIARAAKCDALHPGYGFFAENAAFAARCQREGLTWIGPAPAVIEMMGDKISARRAAAKAGMPIVPGTTQPIRSPADVREASKRIGFPIAVKAAGGGGGKGLKIARDAGEIDQAVSLASKEAAAYFNDATVYLERYLPHPKHVEVQVLGDRHGTVVHLGERDCSLQRRHQKLVEETPARIDPRLRDELLHSALRLAAEIGYDSAGTIECLVEGDDFFFLEMNTRIQVEHTVTEMAWGADLVKAQIRIADGERLWFSQADASPRGHAVECRINAESPALDFRPSAGLITRFDLPAGPGVRVDTAAFAGYAIPQDYDSLIAKLVVWGQDREEARLRMLRALDEVSIEGVDSTVPFLRLLLRDCRFVDGTYATSTVDAFVRERWRELAAAYPEPGLISADNGSAPTELDVDVNGKRFAVRVHGRPNPAFIGGAVRSLKFRPPKRVDRHRSAVESPMHGIVAEIKVAPGDEVSDGQIIAVVEAMKMMNEIVAHRAGKVRSVDVGPGDAVEAGTGLITFDDEKEAVDRRDMGSTARADISDA